MVGLTNSLEFKHYLYDEITNARNILYIEKRGLKIIKRC